MLLSLYFQGSLHLNVLKRSIPKEFQKTERMAPARLLRPRRERARAAFNLTSNFGVAAWRAFGTGVFPAIRAGIGFSGMLNPIMALPETHS